MKADSGITSDRAAECGFIIDPFMCVAMSVCQQQARLYIYLVLRDNKKQLKIIFSCSMFIYSYITSKKQRKRSNLSNPIYSTPAIQNTVYIRRMPISVNFWNTSRAKRAYLILTLWHFVSHTKLLNLPKTKLNPFTK